MAGGIFIPIFKKGQGEKNMKDYVEVDEKKCDEVHNCMCTKEVGEKTYCRGCGNIQPKQEV